MDTVLSLGFKTTGFDATDDDATKNINKQNGSTSNNNSKNNNNGSSSTKEKKIGGGGSKKGAQPSVAALLGQKFRVRRAVEALSEVRAKHLQLIQGTDSNSKS